jgi:hypothetical protein
MMTEAKKPLPIMRDLPGWLTLVIGRFIERRPRALFACLLLGVLAVILCSSPLSHSQSSDFTVVKEEPDAPLPAEQDVAIDDGALWVHRKLMQVRTSASEIPVLRFVECRHYPKDKMKLAQVGITQAGTPLLRFVPGDYCVLSARAPTTEVATATLSATAINRKPYAFAQVSQDAVAQPAVLSAIVGATTPPPSIESGGLLTANQQYACMKFGPACRVALAIQYAENARGACEIYHYNSSDGTLDWGYFQINTAHLKRRGLNLRDLLDCKANIDFAYQLYREEGFTPWTTYTSGEYRRYLPGHDSQVGFRLVSIYKPASNQVKSQLAVMSGNHVTQESVIGLLPERNDTQLVPTEVQNSESSNPIQPTSISSSNARSRSGESTHPAERQRLRVFSPPALFVGTNSIRPPNLDQPPVALESNTDKNEVVSLLGPPLPQATDETLHESETREMKSQTYTGIVVDAMCATHAVTAAPPGPPDDRCDVSPATTLFALRLQNGRILQFDSVGNDRVQNANRKNKWVETASSGKPVHAKVSGSLLGDKLIVVSIH